MNWTALVPLKASGHRKARLAATLSPEERHFLSEKMLAHLNNVLGQVSNISERYLLAPAKSCAWRGPLILDRGRGLNAELHAAREGLDRRNTLIIHPDLPLLSEPEVGELLKLAAETGLAIAIDRHRVGTNAVAVRADQPLVLVFGPESARKFAAQCPAAAILERRGLALDIDTADDLKMLTVATQGAFSRWPRLGTKGRN